MKFTNYLESVLLNELFNIKKQNIILKKIKLNKDSKDFYEIIEDWIIERDITTPSDVLSIDFNDSNLLDFINSKIKKSFLSILSKIKSGNYYIEVKKNYFLFKIANMLYFLNLKEDDGYTEIIFDKFLGRREEQFRSNSLMKISGAKDELFNKISAIIKNEYKGSIKTKVFSFKAALDENEDVLSDVKFFLQTFQNQFSNYVSNKKIDLSDLENTLRSFDNKTKNLLKNYLSNKSQTEDYMEFLNSVFLSKTPKPPTKILPFYKNKLFDESEVESLVMEKSMRVRLYKEVIRAILGPKASIKQKGIETLFSLKELK